MSIAADDPENCALGEECGIHYRVNSRHEDGWFFNFTDYVGVYLIITSVCPEIGALGPRLGNKVAELMGVDPYDTAILKVDDMTLHEKAITAYFDGESDETWSAWTQGYSTAEAAKTGHDMVVQAFRDKMLNLSV